MPQQLQEISQTLPEAQDKPIQPALVVASKRKKQKLSEEDRAVVSAMESLRRELDDLHNRFDNVLDPLLVDSIIYEIQAVHLRHMYYLNLCKERGIICSDFKFENKDPNN